MKFVCYNGKILPANEPVLNAQNSSFKYGDGVFETIKVYKENILLSTLHFERLFVSMQLLKIACNADMETEVSNNIIRLCKKNNCAELGRVRLAVFRNEDNTAGYLIEALSLSPETGKWNVKGFAIDVYPYAKKTIDAFSNLKSANFLAYVMAGLHAKEKGLDDCVLLNTENAICDSSKANIFLIKDKELYTPALHQGCISGVMRRFLLDEFKKQHYPIHEQQIGEQQLHDADEVFLTNAIYGIRWVRMFRNKVYKNNVAHDIHQELIVPFSR